MNTMGTLLFNDTGVSKASSNALKNKVLPFDRAIHEWYRFVLSFPPHLVREYMQQFSIAPDQVVLDPFCGTGTTLVECKKHAIAAVGLEPSPMAFLASRVKTNWNCSPEALWAAAEAIAREAERSFRREGMHDDSDQPLFKHRPSVEDTGVRMSLSDDKMALLLKDSISPLPLHKALVLFDLINRQPDGLLRDYCRLALARSLVADIGNLHFGPEVGVGRPKKDAPVVRSWLGHIRTMVEDLAAAKASVSTTVYQGDARDPAQFLQPRSVDFVITSPPYPNEKDYTRTTRLESVMLGLINSREELRTLKRMLMRSNTRNVYKGDADGEWVRDHREIRSIMQQIEQRRVDLGKTSGFERMYARVTELYFGGMMRHLAELRPILRPGARLAYVVGDQASFLRVMIRTGSILADLAERLGFQAERIDLFRTRLATATQQQLREEVVVLRWPGEKCNG